jgi:hypothetical protein
MWTRPIRIEQRMRIEPMIIRSAEAEMMICFLDKNKASARKQKPERYRKKMMISVIFDLLSM